MPMGHWLIGQGQRRQQEEAQLPPTSSGIKASRLGQSSTLWPQEHVDTRDSSWLSLCLSTRTSIR